MDGLTETRNDIAQWAGFNAGLTWRQSVSNVILALGIIGCAAWAIHAENASEEVRTIALIFDQNLTLLAKADAGKPFVPTDDFYTRFAHELILNFRARPRTKADYLERLDTHVRPFIYDAQLLKSMIRVADEQTHDMGATNVSVSQLSVLRDGERPNPNVVRVKAAWTETSATTNRSRKWEAFLTVRYIPATTGASVGDPGYGMKLVDFQITQINP